MHPRRLFGEICIDMGLVKASDVEHTLQDQAKLKATGKSHKMIGMLMLEKGLLTNEQLIVVIKEMDHLNKSDH